jgi:hypothetical protein
MKYFEAEYRFEKIKIFLGKKLGLSRAKHTEDHKARREQFNELSPDDKMQMVSPQLELYTSATSKKSEVLPVISTIAATLIVVATLNRNLVPLTANETKSILSIFLLLIPATLHYYIKTMEKTAKNDIEIIKSYQTEGIFDELGRPTFLQQLSSDFPIIIVYIFYGIVLLILFRVWFG